jgi:hypothetical protein
MKASIGAKTDLTNLTGEHENPKKSDGRFLWRHICGARKPIKGENQLAEYVSWLEIAECARILEASPIELPSLAALRDQGRVGPEEERSFEEVIQAWTLEVLSSLDGG